MNKKQIPAWIEKYKQKKQKKRRRESKLKRESSKQAAASISQMGETAALAEGIALCAKKARETLFQIMETLILQSEVYDERVHSDAGLTNLCSTELKELWEHARSIIEELREIETEGISIKNYAISYRNDRSQQIRDGKFFSFVFRTAEPYFSPWDNRLDKLNAKYDSVMLRKKEFKEALNDSIFNAEEKEAASSGLGWDKKKSERGRNGRNKRTAKDLKKRTDLIDNNWADWKGETDKAILENLLPKAWMKANPDKQERSILTYITNHHDELKEHIASLRIPKS